MVELDAVNMLSDVEIDNLFTNDNIQEDNPSNGDQNGQEEDKVNIDPENIFQEEDNKSNEDNQVKEDATSDKNNNSTSPNFYSSIAKALKEDSIFPDLNPNEIDDADKFAEMFEKQVQARIEEKIKRFDEAINNGMEPNVAGKYERTLQQLYNIKSEDIVNEDNENLRKNLIYQDLINKGYSKEEALEEVNDAIENGTDIKRAERALKSNINFFNNKYNEEISAAKKLMEQEENKRKEQAENLKKDILLNDKAFGDLEISKENRQKAFDAISKPIYRDPNSGEMLTAIQKYQLENKNEFLKNLGLLFTLTNNFTNLDNLIKGKVNKETKKAFRELENTLNNTNRTSDGNINFLGGSSDDSESIFKNYRLDI